MEFFGVYLLIYKEESFKEEESSHAVSNPILVPAAPTENVWLISRFWDIFGGQAHLIIEVPL